MSDGCREMRATLGAAALGGLEPAEEIALRAHLDGCANCRETLRELSSVARALPLADASRLSSSPMPSPALGEHVFDRVARERSVVRTRRRRRIAWATAAAVAAVAAIVALVVLVPGSPSPGTRVEFAAPAGVEAHATLRATGAGTEVDFHVAGLTVDHYYWLWVTGDDGERIAAGTFQGTARPANMVMTAAVPLHDAQRIWVTDAHNRVVLDRTLPAPAA